MVRREGETGKVVPAMQAMARGERPLKSVASKSQPLRRKQSHRGQMAAAVKRKMERGM
jgi:hypothetical protein